MMEEKKELVCDLCGCKENVEVKSIVTRTSPFSSVTRYKNLCPACWAKYPKEGGYIGVEVTHER